MNRHFVSGIIQRIVTSPVHVHWGFHWHFPMDFHVCGLWCAIFALSLVAEADLPEVRDDVADHEVLPELHKGDRAQALLVSDSFASTVSCMQLLALFGKLFLVSCSMPCRPMSYCLLLLHFRSSPLQSLTSQYSKMGLHLGGARKRLWAVSSWFSRGRRFLNFHGLSPFLATSENDRHLKNSIPPERKTCGKMSSQSTKSGAGEQLMPLDCADARRQGVFCFRHRYGQMLQLIPANWSTFPLVGARDSDGPRNGVVFSTQSLHDFVHRYHWQC